MMYVQCYLHYVFKKQKTVDVIVHDRYSVDDLYDR